MKKKLFLLSLLPLFLLTVHGSSRPVWRACRYVTEAQIDFYQPDRQKTLHYQSPEKLSSLLTCLRLAAPRGQATVMVQDPQVHQYRITLHYSDLTQQVYYLQDYRYLSKDGTTWQKVSVDKAHFFYLLLHMLPPDA